MKIEKIKQVLNDNEAALILSESNRFYLTGFDSSAGIIYISKYKSVFLTDSRYIEKARKVITDFDVVLLIDPFVALNKYLADDKIDNVYVETTSMTLSAFSRYSHSLIATISTDNLLSDTLSQMRAVKTAQEINNIKIAQSFVDDTFDYIIDRIKIGRTEKEIMLDMEFFMRKKGSEGVSFDFIVLSGENTSLPHGTPTDKPIQDGDLVMMDFGGKYNGYCSDMTRTVAVGHIKPECEEAYNVVLEAQLNAISTLLKGTPCKDADKVARDLIKEHGYKGCFQHALGHSLGIDVHESPNLSPREEKSIEVGNVFTVEPAIYNEGEFGIRIEDTVVITEDGYENITKSPKDLKILK